MNFPRFLILAILALSFGTSGASAEVKPCGLFCENVVLQQQMEVPVWGTAADGEVVTAEIQGQRVSTTAANGMWKVAQVLGSGVRFFDIGRN